MPIFINLHRDASGPHLGDGEAHMTLEAAARSASFFDDYLCTHELTDAGQYVGLRDISEAIAKHRCEHENSGNLVSECICNQHAIINSTLDPEWVGVGMWGQQ